MKINIVCVGEIKEKYFKEAIEEYLKRISRFSQISVIEIKEESRQSNIELKKQAEGQQILAKSKGFLVLLDRLGKNISSEQFAEIFEENKLKGVSEFSLIIGGSNGVNDEVIKKADLILSFGKVTFPHQLFRVVLLEQTYRALSISAGLPYHK